MKNLRRSSYSAYADNLVRSFEPRRAPAPCTCHYLRFHLSTSPKNLRFPETLQASDPWRCVHCAIVKNSPWYLQLDGTTEWTHVRKLSKNKRTTYSLKRALGPLTHLNCRVDRLENSCGKIRLPLQLNTPHRMHLRLPWQINRFVVPCPWLNQIPKPSAAHEKMIFCIYTISDASTTHDCRPVLVH